MSPTAVSDVGIYDVTTTISIPTTLSTTASFTINVVHDCTIAVLTDKTISNITYGVTLAQSDTNIFFGDSIRGTVFHTDSTYCGARKYTLTPNTYGWLSIIGDTMTVQTSNLGDVGVYPNIQLKVELLNYPMVASITKTFQVTITCTVTTLVWNSIPSPLVDTTIEVAINPQPHDMFFSVTKTPNCVQDPAFTLTPALAFVTATVAGDGESGTVSIHDATLAN
jgi:hypothetical protein